MKSSKNKILLAALLIAGSLQASAETKTLKITLTNPLNVARTDVPVVVSLRDVPFNVKDAQVSCNGQEIASQIDDLDMNLVSDELAFVTDIEAKGKKTVTVELYSAKQKDRQYKRRTYGDLIVRDPKTKIKNAFPGYIHSLSAPEGVDVFHLVHHHGADFESELVAYRVYFDERQTYDLYGKKQKRLELQASQFYPTDEQLAAGYGDDVLWAGKTVGLGALRGWNAGAPTMVSPVDSRGQRMVVSGPVRTIVELTATRWKLGDVELNMKQNVTIYAGHRDCEVKVSIDGDKREITKAQFTTGVINLSDKVFSDHKGLIGDWGANWPNGAKDSIAGKPKVTVGLAVNVPERYVISEPQGQPDQYLYVLNGKGATEFSYNMAFTSCTESFGFKDSKEWFAWMRQWKKELEAPVKVTIE